MKPQLALVLTEEDAPKHQSQLAPKDNKFHKGNGADGKHYWLTPPELYKKLDAEFSFDFDPCPYPRPEGFDGLFCDWGRSNYVNPPFGSVAYPMLDKNGNQRFNNKGKAMVKKMGPTAWIRKAILEQQKGNLVVLVYPMDKWVLMALAAIGTKVRNLGDVKWVATEDRTAGKGTGRHIACFIFEPTNTIDGEVIELSPRRLT